MFKAVSFLVVSASHIKSPGRLLFKYLEVGYDSGEGGIRVGWMDRRGAARVSSYEWADVCVMRHRVSQNWASSERMRFAPVCWENENRREGTAPLHWGLVFPGGWSWSQWRWLLRACWFISWWVVRTVCNLWGRKWLGCCREKEHFL